MVLTFSEREGFSSPTKAIQLASMDNDLKTSLWNTLYTYCFRHTDYPQATMMAYRNIDKENSVCNFLDLLWVYFLKLKVRRGEQACRV